VPGKRTALYKYLTKRRKRCTEHKYPIRLKVPEAIKLAEESRTDWNIVVITSASLHKGQYELIRRLALAGKKIAVIHGSYPKDTLPDSVSQIVASYWTSPEALAAAGAVLFGELKPRGSAPLKQTVNLE
jgi:hypothetical protein